MARTGAGGRRQRDRGRLRRRARAGPGGADAVHDGRLSRSRAPRSRSPTPTPTPAPIWSSSAIPYSDPLADGPVIHAAATRALEAGATLDSGPRDLRAARRAGPGGRDGLREHGPRPRTAPLRPRARRRRRERRDRPRPAARGERRRWPRRCAPPGSRWCRCVAPTTPPSGGRGSAPPREGFVYLVSDTRTTGERDELPAALARAGRARPGPTRRFRSRSASGSARPSRRPRSARVADGVIIGSRLVRAVAEAADAAGRGRAVGASSRRLPRRDVRAGRVGCAPHAAARLHRRRPARADRSPTRSRSAAPSAALIFLFILFNGILDRWAKPLIDWVRA